MVDRLILTGALEDPDSARQYLIGLEEMEVNGYSKAYGTHFDEEIGRWLEVR